MANEEQLSILKQGVEVWNKWRQLNFNIDVDFVEANFGEAHFSQVNLMGADLSRANLREADLARAKLHKANLSEANLSQASLVEALLNEANLTGADLSNTELRRANLNKTNLNKTLLRKVDLRGADLREANLKGADLYRAHINGASLEGANLSEADLMEADLNGAYLSKSIFWKARVGATIFGNSNLSEVIGLESVVHNFPSSISTDTFSLSKGKISEIFLQGCGLSDWEIEAVKLYDSDLSNEQRNKILYRVYDLQASQAIQISPLFMSYSHADSIFVDKVGYSLNKKGIRFWRDIHDMKAGRMEKQIDRAIRQNPTVLLVLSEHSLSSDWVEHEVRTARGFEKEIGRDVLCPIALDDSWKDSRWPKRVMEQIMEYNILDFSAWKDDSKFDGMFRKLIDGLELFYKG